MMHRSLFANATKAMMCSYTIKVGEHEKGTDIPHTSGTCLTPYVSRDHNVVLDPGVVPS